ncbi:TetR/AcrR family transcriptional regulator [Roseibium sp. M-1]
MKMETKRGRPRKFDEEETLDRIMQVFWRQGFAATSLDQIAEDTGLNRPSLYAAFGGKKEMFLRAVDRFADQMQSYLSEAGRKTEGLKPRLKAIMTAAIDLYTGRSGFCGASYGCLVIATLPAEAVADADFHAALQRVTGRMDKGFASLIRHETGGLVEEAEIMATAQLLSLVLHGLSVRARAGEAPGVLKELAASAVERLVP